MRIYVSCVLAELLAQTGYENGTPDGSVPAAAAARPAAARPTANLKTLHKPGVKEIFECVTHGLKALLTVLFFPLVRWPGPGVLTNGCVRPLCCFGEAEF